MSPHVAFVVQRCGLDVNGGAELHCRLVAEKLSKNFTVEVLTTCALDYMTWKNHYAPGEEHLEGLTIRRFPVAHIRDVEAFNRLSANLQPRVRSASIAEGEEWMRQQGPWSPELLAYLQTHARDYDAFIFFTYLYATTYFGLPLVHHRAILAPLAHDEWPIYFSMWDRIFGAPQGFLFNSEEEASFLRRRFPDARLNGPIVGVGVEPPARLDPGAFRRSFQIDSPFVLYAGRVDESKGIGQLLADFAAYRRSSGDEQTELVLVGQRVMEIAEQPGVRAVGFVSESDKWNALAASEAVVIPSRYESLSMVLLEAWSVRKPALVTAASEVLVGQCRRSQGGVWYANTDEFCAALDLLLHDARIRDGLGAQGAAYVYANYDWARIVDAYRTAISRVTEP